MSRIAAAYGMVVPRGATWEDEFNYTDENGVAIDLTGYKAELQVRSLAGQYGVTDAETLLLDITTDTAGGVLVIDTPDGETVPCRVRIRIPPATHAVLNPLNKRREKYAYSLRVFIPAGVDPIYVVPLVSGQLTALGEVIR